MNFINNELKYWNLQNTKDNLLATFSIKSATVCEVKNFNVFSLLTATFDVLNTLYSINDLDNGVLKALK